MIKDEDHTIDHNYIFIRVKKESLDLDRKKKRNELKLKLMNDVHQMYKKIISIEKVKIPSFKIKIH